MAEQSGGPLSGYWTGVFSYDQADDAPTPFNAVLTQRGERLTGEIIEPNTFVETVDRELFSSLTGVAYGPDIAFVKTYEPLPGAGHKVAYRGAVVDEATRIEGEWRYEARWTGRFVMNRLVDRSETRNAATESADANAEA